MEKIKILHLLASDRLSGAESVVCDIIENSSDKFEHFYCSVNGPIKKVLVDRNISFFPIKKLNIKNVSKVINEINPNIIHAHDFRAGVIASLCKKNCKLISHIHNNSLWIRKICIKSMIFLLSSLKADKILVVSNSIKNEFIFKRFITKKIVCVNNPVIREKIISKVENNKKEIKYDICCIARLSEAKDPMKFLKIIFELVKNNKELKVIWVGDGEMKNEVLSKANEMQLIDNISFLGFKENPYVYLNQSKVFMLTSKWEGYGLVAFEALTLGKPCVVSNVGGLRNIVDSTCGELCNPNNIHEYINETEKLLLDKNYYNRKSKKAIKKSILLDNQKFYFNNLENIYLNILLKH